MKSHWIVNRILLLAIGLIFLLPVTSPAAWPDLTAQQLKGMLDSGQKIFLLNPLSDIEFNEAHIPGSVNVPLHTIMRSKKMPENRDIPIVAYCLSKQ
jgi:3-mercaptopyruvate sulfurtransferase SseA